MKTLSVKLLDEIGHNISEGILMDLPDFGKFDSGLPGGNNTGGYPGGGFPSGGGYPGGGYPSGGGGGATIQLDPSKGIGINIGITTYPNQFQQQPYQQQQYQPQQYQQPYQQQPYQQQQQPYQQQPYQQPTYQQQQPYQPTYGQQQPYQQQPYQQPDYQQPTFQQPTYQQPTFQPQQQQPTTQIQPTFQQPSGGSQPTSTTNLAPKKEDVKPSPIDFGGSGDSSYPTFKKMTIEPYPGAPKNDLDDFQARLKKIKDGL